MGQWKLNVLLQCSIFKRYEMEILSREQRLLAPLLNLKIKLYSIIKLIIVKSKYLQQFTIYVRLPTLNN